MKKFRILLILLAVISIGVYSCKDDSDDNNDVVSQQDRDFAKNAALSNIAEISLGELALQRADHDSVLAFARMMISDHNASRNQLDSIAKRLNVVLPTDLDSKHVALRTRLMGLNNAAFDTAYINSQFSDHLTARTIHQTEIDMGNNKDLVDYAKKKLTVINKHFQKASDIRELLKKR
ncbi:MAG TPA: DUF4142 domain-containing protein [Bacteroidales bacterium]|nr:DUF4142 domain-containing protein [Bacteroidales bacterium]